MADAKIILQRLEELQTSSREYLAQELKKVNELVGDNGASLLCGEHVRASFFTAAMKAVAIISMASSGMNQELLMQTMDTMKAVSKVASASHNRILAQMLMRLIDEEKAEKAYYMVGELANHEERRVADFLKFAINHISTGEEND